MYYACAYYPEYFQSRRSWQPVGHIAMRRNGLDAHPGLGCPSSRYTVHGIVVRFTYNACYDILHI